MAAGQGFKTFTTGEVLTAADVNGYLMQGINVFASSAARSAAITSPQEGQYSFLKDTNALEYYDGATWVGAPVGDITAVTAGKGLTGGGSSGDVTVALATTAKGDLVAGSGTTTAAVLTVGADNTVLTADSSTATGLKWASAASGGGMTQLASGNISTGTTGLDLTSISQSYKSLQLVIRNLYMAATGLGTTLRFNNDSGANYYGAQLWQNAGSAGTGAYNGANNFDVGYLNTSSSSSDGQFVILDIPDYTNTTAWKCTNLYSGGQNGNSPFALNNFNILGYYKSKTALDRITMTSGGAGFGGGTYILYGVN